MAETLEESIKRLESYYLDRMRQEDLQWKKQDEQRVKILELKRRQMQKNVDLMNRSGQIRARSSLGLSTITHSFSPEDYLECTCNLTAEERRAKKLGESLPHGKGLSIQEVSRHAGCKLNSKDIDDAYECTFSVGARNSSTEYAIKSAFERGHMACTNNGLRSQTSKLFTEPRQTKDYLGYNGNRARNYDTAADLMKKYKTFSNSFSKILQPELADSSSKVTRMTTMSLNNALNYSTMPYVGACNSLHSFEKDSEKDDGSGYEDEKISDFTRPPGEEVNTRYFKTRENIIHPGASDNIVVSARRPELYRNPLDELLKTRTNTNKASIEAECISYLATGKANVYSDEIASGAASVGNLAETYNKFGAAGTIRAVHLAETAAERARDEPQSFSENSDDEGTSLALVAIANAANVLKNKKNSEKKRKVKNNNSRTSASSDTKGSSMAQGEADEPRNSLVIDIDGDYSGKSVFGDMDGNARHDRDTGLKVIRRLKGKTLSLKEQVDRERDLQKDLTTEELPKLKDILRSEYKVSSLAAERPSVQQQLPTSVMPLLKSSIIMNCNGTATEKLSSTVGKQGLKKTAAFLDTLATENDAYSPIDYSIGVSRLIMDAEDQRNANDFLNSMNSKQQKAGVSIKADSYAQNSRMDIANQALAGTSKNWKSMKTFGTMSDYYPSSATGKFADNSGNKKISMQKKKVKFATSELVSVVDDRITNEQPNQFTAGYLNVDPIAEFETLHAGEWD